MIVEGREKVWWWGGLLVRFAAISLPHTHTHTVQNFFLSVTNQGGLAETVFIANVSEGFYLQIAIFENQKSKRAVNFD